MFTEEEVKLLANRWYLWKGLFLGSIGMLVGLMAFGWLLGY